MLMFDDHLRAIIGHREQSPTDFIKGSASFAVRMKDQHESPSQKEPLLRQSTTRPCKSSFGCEHDRMQAKIELAPFLLDGVKDRFQFAVPLKIQRHKNRRTDFLRQRFHVCSRLVIQIMIATSAPNAVEHFGAPPRDRLVVRYAGYQASFP